ncbi:hypothetical protein [Myceligenerans indicum]|uniref:Uncharacterized protein n=1 Tax=Myceligenerans indicum TaxID=2593663 RepID=A0ABS1LI55_9MICO|nr:hypothetical protein [Myceligenerans indicum]MBL0885910.1 hypothetical protein [Myceligenerans indicum]
MAERQRQQRDGAVPDSVLVSPQGLAHFGGCSHKDDTDYSRWGVLDATDVWQRLGNGESFTIKDDGGRRLVVAGRCRDCVEHGPW